MTDPYLARALARVRAIHSAMEEATTQAEARRALARWMALSKEATAGNGRLAMAMLEVRYPDNWSSDSTRRRRRA